MTKFFSPFFLVLSSLTNLKEQLLMVLSLIWQSLWTFWELFSGPMRLLITQSVEKKNKAIFPVKKKYLNIFSPFIEFDKPQRTNYSGPQSILTLVVQMTWTFLWDLRGRWKQTFQKVAVFTMTNVFGPNFLVPSSVTNIAKQCIGIGKLFWQVLRNF